MQQFLRNEVVSRSLSFLQVGVSGYVKDNSGKEFASASFPYMENANGKASYDSTVQYIFIHNGYVAQSITYMLN